MQDGAQRPTSRAGYKKITQTCQQALKDRIEYVWVDTCCIDKTSSAELSEAINSMFRWYENAEICYVYLSDVSTASGARQTLTQSRWFTRGWTLQELIAPCKLVFYAATWQPIDDRGKLSKLISDATGIDETFLRDDRAKVGTMLKSSSIAQRMSWASTRQTTRTEDLAYCLMGIFDISMPLLYGEGNKAFIRLQEEIIRHTDDQSIFAWNALGCSPSDRTTSRDRHLQRDTGVLAPSPAAFAESGEILSVDAGESAPFSLTNHGIRIDLRVFREKSGAYGVLHCRRGHAANLLAIPLRELPGSRFDRDTSLETKWVDYQEWHRAPKIPVYLLTELTPGKYKIPNGCFLVKSLPEGVSLKRVSAGYTWSPATSLITKGTIEDRFRGKDVLQVVLLSDSLDKRSIYEVITISVTVRRLYRHSWGPQWVTYDVRYSNVGLSIEGEGRSIGSFFVRVQEQDVFGQEVIVIEVLPWGKKSDIAKRLLWAQVRLNVLLSRFLFVTVDKTGAWRLYEYWKEILEFGLIRPAIIVALGLALWPPPSSQLLSGFGVAARMTTSVLSSLSTRYAIGSALYL
ncbi:hypothetical protein NW755_014126, partial [Fusarium falciforme]